MKRVLLIHCRTIGIAQKLNLLMDNDNLHHKFPLAAKKEIAINGCIDKLCEGFAKAL